MRSQVRPKISAGSGTTPSGEGWCWWSPSNSLWHVLPDSVNGNYHHFCCVWYLNSGSCRWLSETGKVHLGFAVRFLWTWPAHISAPAFKGRFRQSGWTDTSSGLRVRPQSTVKWRCRRTGNKHGASCMWQQAKGAVGGWGLCSCSRTGDGPGREALGPQKVS